MYWVLCFAVTVIWSDTENILSGQFVVVHVRQGAHMCMFRLHTNSNVSVRESPSWESPNTFPMIQIRSKFLHQNSVPSLNSSYTWCNPEPEKCLPITVSLSSNINVHARTGTRLWTWLAGNASKTRFVIKWLFPPRFSNNNRYTSSHPTLCWLLPPLQSNKTAHLNGGGRVLRSSWRESMRLGAP